MLLNATLWFTVTFTIKGKETKAGNLVQINLYYTLKTFFRLLTSIWKFVPIVYIEVLFFFPKLHIFFVISSYIADLETNLPIGKQTLLVFTWNFKDIVGKGLFWCFIYVFVSISCFSLSLLTIYAVERNVVAYCHAYI